MTIENRSASAEETLLGESSELSKSDPITTAARAWRAGDRATGRYSDTSSARASGAAPPSRVTNSRHLKLSYRIGACQAGVCAENLDPAILVMKTAENRSRCDGAEALNRPMDRGHAAASEHQGVSLMGLGKRGRFAVDQPTITG
jgi:hypothetical protein